MNTRDKANAIRKHYRYYLKALKQRPRDNKSMQQNKDWLLVLCANDDRLYAVAALESSKYNTCDYLSKPLYERLELHKQFN